MADQVQYTLERMIPVLEDLIIAGIFTRAEVKSIIEKRRDFEYLINRPGKERQDFIKYIQYEIKLDQLIKQRMNRLGIKHSPSQFQGIKRIHTLFRSAVGRFKSDTSLWLQFMDFQIRCGSHTSVARTFAEALALHPTHIGLWLLAAGWEYTQNYNMNQARALLQRAIRLNSESADLYYEYCRLELMYLEKVKARIEFAKKNGVEDVAGEEKKEKEEKEEKDSDDSDNSDDSGEGSEEGIDLDALPDAEEKKGATPGYTQSSDIFLSGEVPRIVYASAVKALPSDLSVYQTFISIFRKFPGTEASVDRVYSDIHEKFGSDSTAFIFLCQRPIHEFYENKMREFLDDKEDDEESHDDSSSAEEARELEWVDVDVAFDGEYVEALDKTLENFGKDQELLKTNSVAMFGYLHFLLDQYKKFSVKPNENILVMEKLQQKVNEVYEWKKASKECSPSSILSIALFFLSTSKISLAFEVLEHGTTQNPTQPLLWAERLKLLWLFRNEPSSPEIDLPSLLSLYETALVAIEKSADPKSPEAKITKQKHILRIYSQILTILVTEGEDYSRFKKWYRRACNLTVAQEVLVEFKQDMLELVLKNLNIQDASDFCTYSISFPPLTAKYLSKVIAFEKNNTSNSVSVDPFRLTQLYNMAIEKFGTNDHQIWLDYIMWEQSQKNFKEANSLYWRAIKALATPETFIQKHHQLVNAQEQ
eukprot:TRINITY_DN15273_c0_g1_i1.p1 TRINITY_DN15273_c0_g1~~TRINITY_DN15273_c0_g1_i1.p1  ORF type:complete len:705 (+),score=188.34 TRINITY_DN15273_c0_g1_i1:21-2135(+)